MYHSKHINKDFYMFQLHINDNNTNTPFFFMANYNKKDDI